MNANLYVGISMFFLILRQLGLYDEYIKEYMIDHRVTSVLKIKHNLASLLSKDPSIKGNNSHLKAFYRLCNSFVNVGISFGWSRTKKGAIFWSETCELIHYAYDRYMIAHHLPDPYKK